MERVLTIDDVVKLIRKHQGKRMQYELAAEWGVSPIYISDVLRKRRLPMEKILGHF